MTSGQGSDRTAKRASSPDVDDVGRTIDARGLACPMPVLELAKAVDQVEVGQRVHLLATDPAAKVDVPVWCRMQRQRLHRQELEEQVWHFEVERVH